MSKDDSDTRRLLDVAQELLEQRQPDFEAIVELLGDVPMQDLDVQTRGAATNARLLAAAALEGSIAKVAVARFALARLVVLLEKHVGVEGRN